MSDLLSAFRPNTLEFADAAHLLTRAGFGASYADIQRAIADGLDATVTRLTTPQDESVDFHATDRLLRGAAIDSGNIGDLKAWWLFRMTHSANPLVEKLSLFWHNHFATSNAKVDSVRFMLDQNDLMRKHALGDFRPLLHAMARNVAMLIWLDSNANRKRQANENFAREVMELFSLGVGNYTETDIKEAARAFTGWHVRDDRFWFNKLQHDFTSKTVLGKTAQDGQDVLEICLERRACPRFLSMKLLRTFVTGDPQPEWIDAFADRIRVNNIDVQRCMSELLRSKLFFDPQVRRTLIKSPIDLVIGSYRTLECRPNLQNTARLLAELGQDVFEPPTVKGWEGGRLWISSTTILRRANFAAMLTKENRLGELPDPVELIDRNGWNATAETVVDEFSNL
ncbi:MAG: DUF1800 domain-containing protein, partial [Planctomycetota bacterium]|nr:DUF1800 domain-containing protein [Planctomycetota bacterium]